MNDKEKLEKIYQIIHPKLIPINEGEVKVDYLYIWDCLQYIEEMKIEDRDRFTKLYSSIILSWKDKRQPIDNEPASIDVMISLIDNK